MKQGFILFLSMMMMAGSMLPNNDMHELVKVPALVQHYFEHDEHEGLSFFDFLVMHYGDDGSKTSSDEHENLPFFHHCPVTIVYTCPETTEPSIEVPEAEFTLAEYAHPIYFSQSQNTVFQPPRI